MAEVVDNYEGPKRGYSSKYPWDEWFNGQTWRLTQGTPEQVESGEADFSCKMESMDFLIRKTYRDRPDVETVSVSRESDTTLVITAKLGNKIMPKARNNRVRTNASKAPKHRKK